MKNLIKSILPFAFLVVVTGAVSAAVAVPKAECKNNRCENFQVGMYRVKNTLTMNFLMEKEKGQRVVLRLMDGKGKVIHEEYVSKSIRKFGRKFNFSEVPDGRYTLEISDENERIVKDIFLKTNEVMEVQGRNLAAMN
jgi:hypothetical protein